MLSLRREIDSLKLVAKTTRNRTIPIQTEQLRRVLDLVTGVVGAIEYSLDKRQFYYDSTPEITLQRIRERLRYSVVPLDIELERKSA